MRVSRHSWHFRYYCFWRTCTSAESPYMFFDLLRRKESVQGDFYPRSICSYFWFCVFATLFIPLVCVVILIATVLIVTLGWPFFKIHDRNERLREEGKKKPKTSGVVKTFVKAKKEKVCPLIEMVD